MSALQMGIASGCLVGLGVALLIWRLAPGVPALPGALSRLAPERVPSTVVVGASSDGSLTDRLGIWAQRRLPAGVWGTVPLRELGMLQIPVHRYFGQKVVFFFVGAFFPSVVSLLFAMMGIRLGWVLPVGASLGLGVALSFLSNYNVRSDAKEARTEFAHALAAFIDLVALERLAGSGTNQALERAADIGDSWVFIRLQEGLARARWAGTPPWDALTELAADLTLPELSELADIMRLSGEEGATVYATLRARASSMRNALLSAELSKANAAGERLSFPVSTLAIIFLLLLATPALLQIVGSV